MGFEDEYAGRKKKKDPITAFLPFLGLILAMAFAAIAWVLREPAHEFLIEQISDFPQEEEMAYAVAGVLFLIMMMLAALVYALFAPKPHHKLVTEKELKREKEAIDREHLERKRRKRRMRQQAAKEREEQRKRAQK
jgi:hypothetical protein